MTADLEEERPNDPTQEGSAQPDRAPSGCGNGVRLFQSGAGWSTGSSSVGHPINSSGGCAFLDARAFSPLLSRSKHPYQPPGLGRSTVDNRRAGTCQCKTAAPCPPPAPTVEFGLFSDDVYGDPTQHPYPLYQNVKAWLLTWHNIPCQATGPAGPSPKPQVCDDVVIIDADSAKYLPQYQGPT
jgi:hypothetical protein